jgi:sugar lactone lactonase YvrE
MVIEWDGVVFRYSPDGELLTMFGQQDGGRYHGMCTDKWGNVYIAARNPAGTLAYIKKYNYSGALIVTWITDRDGHVGFPRSMFVGPDDSLYVTDEKGVDVFVPMASQTAIE